MSDTPQELMGQFGECVYCESPIMVWEDRVCVDGALKWAHKGCASDEDAMYEQGDA